MLKEFNTKFCAQDTKTNGTQVGACDSQDERRRTFRVLESILTQFPLRFNTNFCVRGMKTNGTQVGACGSQDERRRTLLDAHLQHEAAARRQRRQQRERRLAHPVQRRPRRRVPLRQAVEQRVPRQQRPESATAARRATNMSHSTAAPAKCVAGMWTNTFGLTLNLMFLSGEEGGPDKKHWKRDLARNFQANTPLLPNKRFTPCRTGTVRVRVQERRTPPWRKL